MGAGQNTVTLGLLPGDGIGPEIVESACAVTEAALEMQGVTVDWRRLPFGRDAIDTHGTPLPEATVAALGDLQAWLLGSGAGEFMPTADTAMSISLFTGRPASGSRTRHFVSPPPAGGR